MISQLIRTSTEVVFWVLALSLIVALTGCDEQDAQPGTQQECVLTSQGDVCRTPEGIEQNEQK